MHRVHLTDGIPVELPEHPGLDSNVDHAPIRREILNPDEKKLALRNALRYFKEDFHDVLAPEFAHELNTYGRIYMHRFRPVNEEMKAYPIDSYPAKSQQAAAIMLMIQNNLEHQH